MQPEQGSQTELVAGLNSIALAIQNAFGTGSIRLGKVNNTAAVSITTSNTTLFSTLNITVPGARTVRVYIHCANLIGTASTDRCRFDILVDGVVVQQTYTGANNPSGRIIEADVSMSNGAHAITARAQKDIGAGTVSFYADASGANTYIVAELVT